MRSSKLFVKHVLWNETNVANIIPVSKFTDKANINECKCGCTSDNHNTEMSLFGPIHWGLKKNVKHSAYDNFKLCVLLNENIWILNKMSLKLSIGLVSNKYSCLGRYNIYIYHIMVISWDLYWDTYRTMAIRYCFTPRVYLFCVKIIFISGSIKILQSSFFTCSEFCYCWWYSHQDTYRDTVIKMCIVTLKN